MAVAVRQKLAEMLVANGTFHLVAPIERTDQEAKQIAAPDQELAGKQLGQKGYEFLHGLLF
jgi:hypothetical protein